MSDSDASDVEKYVHDGTLLTRMSYHHEQLKHSASSISGSSSACRSGGKCSFLKVFDPETATACLPPGAEVLDHCRRSTRCQTLLQRPQIALCKG